jgi:hypothetical protein
MAPDPASLLGGLRAATRPAVTCGPRASNVKKNLAGLPVRVDLRVLNTHHLLLLAGSTLLYRDPTTPEPPIELWVIE